jgi:hypothetical protein
VRAGAEERLEDDQVDEEAACADSRELQQPDNLASRRELPCCDVLAQRGAS